MEPSTIPVRSAPTCEKRRSSPLFAYILLVTLCLFAKPCAAQIASVTDNSGRRLFVNQEPPTLIKVKAAATSKPRATIYLQNETAFGVAARPWMSIDRDGVEKIVREAAERHHVDPALVRAVIETESNWNPRAFSRKGAGGLMQLIPTTAQRYGANDLFNPEQNIDAGVRHLKMLLLRYNGNLDLALAAYNAGEGTVDRFGGIPPIRETRNYVQKVQNAYFRPGSGRMTDLFVNPRAIRKNVDESGRIVFTND
jgi:soluble lytic murein transglycosylase-like protein